MADMTPICMMEAIKHSVESLELSEAAKLQEFRKMQKDYIGDSSPTISSVGAHGAIIHYHPDSSSDAEIVVDQMHLCNSGAQYRDGTTKRCILALRSSFRRSATLKSLKDT
nr:unnamed protein product [Callosobruchus analis]